MKNKSQITFRKSLGFRISTSFLVISILIIGVLSISSFYLANNLVIKNTADRALKIAEESSKYIDVNEFNKLKSIDDENKPYYEKLRNELSYIRKISGSKYLYTMRKTDNGDFMYVVDGSEIEDISHIGDTEDWTEEFELTWNGENYIGDTIEVNEWGVLISSYYPIKDNNGNIVGLVGVDYDAEDVYNGLKKLGETVIIITSIMLFLVIVFGVLITKNITKPIKALSYSFEKIADYELDVEVFDIKREDEIGLLFKSFNKTIENLKYLINNLKNASNQVTSSSHNLAISVERTNEATEQIATTANLTADNSVRQLESVNEITALVEQLSSGIKEISTNSKDMFNLSKETSVVTNSGLDTVSNMVNEMKEIAIAVKEISGIIESLGKHSVEIGNIVKVITDISEQTNLLALNASIEAARAGEHGKGFVVVAEEVRKLAEQSKVSADKISSTIKAIQLDTSNAVVSMDKGTNIVENGLNVTNKVNESFKSINESIINVLDKVQEVSIAVEQMENGSQRVVNEMDIIRKVAEEGSASSQENSASIEEQLATMEEIGGASNLLDKLGKELQQTINKFKL